MKRFICLTLLGLFATQLHAEETKATHEQHGAHEHGVATLAIAVSKDGAEIVLESPAANLVGFEHTARTDEEKQKLLAATQTLQAGDKLFTLSPDADCKLDNAAISSNVEGDNAKDHEAKADHEAGESHSDIDVTWSYSCSKPEALTSIGIKLFSAFPNGFTKLKAEWVTDKGASAKELNADTEITL